MTVAPAPTLTAPAVAAPPIPTLQDARAAAQVLVDDGACRVLVFGSLARGEARPGSDIDLVAIYPDIDYTSRRLTRLRLQGECEAWTGYRCDVHVTDLPEWSTRVAGVSSSFEAHVAEHAVLLVETPHTDAIDWDKKMSLPSSNLDEALQQLGNVARALNGLMAVCKPNDELESDENPLRQADVADRLSLVCQQSAMVIETTLKALLAASGQYPEFTHDIYRLAEKLQPLRQEFRDILEPLRESRLPDSASVRRGKDGPKPPLNDITIWPQGGAYPADFPDIGYDDVARLAPAVAAAAYQLALEVCDEIEHLGASSTATHIARTRRLASGVKQRVETTDLATGEPLPTSEHDPTTTDGEGLLGWFQHRRAHRAKVRQNRAERKRRGVQPPIPELKAAGRCGKETATGAPCQRLVAPGGKCPDHD